MSEPSEFFPDQDLLREAIQKEYEVLACEPRRGFHFHTGLPLAEKLGYDKDWLEGIPVGSSESFAGPGIPSVTVNFGGASECWTSAVAQA